MDLLHNRLQSKATHSYPQLLPVVSCCFAFNKTPGPKKHPGHGPGIIEMRLRKIAWNYIRSWFILDITIVTIARPWVGCDPAGINGPLSGHGKNSAFRWRVSSQNWPYQHTTGVLVKMFPTPLACGIFPPKSHGLFSICSILFHIFHPSQHQSTTFSSFSSLPFLGP